MPSDFSPELEAMISVPRLGTYLKLVGNENQEEALLLYRLNAELSGAFMFPLQSLEVALRDVLSQRLNDFFGADDWLINVPPSNAAVFSWTEKNIRHIDEAKDRFRQLKRREPTQGAIIADLTMGFWIDFLHKRNNRLWPHISGAFPKSPGNIDSRRGVTLDNLIIVRNFRNRLAHHEVIVNQPGSPLAAHERMIEILGWISAEKAEWTRKHSQVGDIWNRIAAEKVNRGWSGLTNI